mmetsp:Transcript_11829/g.26871  ORF Transcript_11829/g.26871 Transcript_11829/m.26871 type:complete len:220 (-) Transcript_11829:1929-2588(-)
MRASMSRLSSTSSSLCLVSASAADGDKGAVILAAWIAARLSCKVAMSILQSCISLLPTVARLSSGALTAFFNSATSDTMSETSLRKSSVLKASRRCKRSCTSLPTELLHAKTSSFSSSKGRRHSSKTKRSSSASLSVTTGESPPAPASFATSCFSLVKSSWPSVALTIASLHVSSMFLMRSKSEQNVEVIACTSDLSSVNASPTLSSAALAVMACICVA